MLHLLVPSAFLQDSNNDLLTTPATLMLVFLFHFDQSQAMCSSVLGDLEHADVLVSWVADEPIAVDELFINHLIILFTHLNLRHIPYYSYIRIQ